MTRNSMLVACVMVCALVSMLGLARAANAQPTYFHDDFEGLALKPNWIQPPASHWAYDVSGGNLNVTGLFYPSEPKTGFNFAEMFTILDTPAIGDFQAEVRLAFDLSAPPKIDHRSAGLMLSSGDPGTPNMPPLGIVLDEVGGQELRVLMVSGGQLLSTPVFQNNTGQIVLSMTRLGSEIHFGMDGTAIGILPSSTADPIKSLGVRFQAGWPSASFEPMHFDRVSVIPSPGVGVAVLLSLPLFAARSRR